ncbi:unnamed protein product [Leptosia nina]|uniref:Uncharacterized protein n=1 Tax=Leptosia nina TaxID=320188 RepID=A0AAV1JYM8_9NEOP
MDIFLNFMEYALEEVKAKELKKFLQKVRKYLLFLLRFVLSVPIFILDVPAITAAGTKSVGRSNIFHKKMHPMQEHLNNNLEYRLLQIVGLQVRLECREAHHLGCIFLLAKIKNGGRNEPAALQQPDHCAHLFPSFR